MVEFELFFFASRRVTLLLLAQKKVTKEKSTPCRLFPALLAKAGGCGTRALPSDGSLRKHPLRLRCSARQQGIYGQHHADAMVAS